MNQAVLPAGEILAGYEDALAVSRSYKYGRAVARGTTVLQLAIAALNLSGGDFARDLLALINECQAIDRRWLASAQFPSA